MADERPQRAQQFVDKDLMLIAMQMGIPAGKAANDIVGKMFYDRGDRGVVLLRYGDLSSPPGEAYLRNFVREIIHTYPSPFEHELHAMAGRGELAGDDERPPAALQPSDERVTEMRDQVRRSF